MQDGYGVICNPFGLRSLRSLDIAFYFHEQL